MRGILASALLATAAVPAGAATTLFSQNFDAVPVGVPAAGVPGFSIVGTVDVVDDNTFGIRCAGNAGRCLDLDGTPGPGQITSTAIALSAGRTVTVSFQLSGNQRDQIDDLFRSDMLLGGPTDVADFTCIATFGCGVIPFIAGATQFGPYFEQVPAVRGWQTYAFSFRPLQDTTLTMRFSTNSRNFIGPLLDDVLVTQSEVPEPASWAMLIAGFGLVGAVARRRTAPAAA